MTLIFSCNSNDDVVGGQQILTNDTSNTTGELTVRVINQNGQRVNNVRVSLYATYEDLQNDIWIYDLLPVNVNNGDAYFGFINIGNYYIFAEVQGTGRNNAPGDVAQVRSQKQTLREVVVR